MKKNIFFPVILLLMLFISCAVHTAPVSDSRVNWMGKEELLSILDERGLVLFDARYSKDWKHSDQKIKGAIRLDASEVEQLDGFYPAGQKIIIYCA